MVRDTIIAAKFALPWIRTLTTPRSRSRHAVLSYSRGALSSTFVPVFSEYWHHGRVKSAWKTFSIVATVTFLIGTGFVILAEVFAPAFVRLLNPGYGPAQIALAVPLTRIVLPAQVFFLMGGLLIGTQNARGMFNTAALAPCIYNIGIILGALVFVPMLTPPGSAPNIFRVNVGRSSRGICRQFHVSACASGQTGTAFSAQCANSVSGRSKDLKMMLPILLGVSLPNVDQIINSIFATELHTIGSQTWLQYANRVMLIPIGIFGQAMGIAILPTMSAMAAGKQNRQFKRTVNAGLRIILFLTVPASALFYLLPFQ